MNPGPPFPSESFVRALFDGRIDYSPLVPFPDLSHGRVQQVSELLSRLRLSPHASIGMEQLQNWDILQKQNAWSTPVLTRVIRQLGGTDVSAALCAIAHLALGVRLIRSFGSPAQQAEYEENSEPLCAFALTEETPGSDVSRIQTYAEPRGDGFVLSGTKHWVTNGEWATHFIVVARTAPSFASDKPKLTCFLVKRSSHIHVVPVNTDVLPGAGLARVTFENVPLTRQDILGSLGKGFRVVISGLSEARLFVGAAVLGACITAYNDTLKRVSGRRAFGRPVGKFPSVQYRVAGMLAEILAMESLVHGVAAFAEPGTHLDPVERGVVRLSVARGAARVLEAARELHGSAAFTGDVSASRHTQAARALTLLDGSDLALESYVALEGTRQVRHRLQRLSPQSDVLTRADAALGLIARLAKQKLRSKKGADPAGLSLGKLHQFAETLGRLLEEALIKHGVELIEKQHLHSRVAQAVVELSTWSALAARVETSLEKAGPVGSKRMIDSARVWIRGSEGRLTRLLSGIESSDDALRDAIATRAYTDASYPFDIF